MPRTLQDAGDSTSQKSRFAAILDGNSLMIIGLAGRAGAGKNTVGDIIERRYGFRQTSFAHALKAEVASITLDKNPAPADIKARAIHEPAIAEIASLLPFAVGMDPYGKPTHPTMRRLLQLWGTEYRRDVHEDYWVRRCDLTGDVVVTDVRFQNEADVCDIVLYVYRTDAESKEPTHASECTLTLDSVDAIVLNDSNLADLEQSVDQALQSLDFVTASAA